MSSIGTIQFAINTEENTHIISEHPVGSMSRMMAEMLSEKLSFLGINSSMAKLIVTKPEENTHKQIVYTNMLPIETAKKILLEQYFDYCLYGRINFSDILDVEVSLLDSRDEKNLWRRLIKAKNNDFSELSNRIIEEISKIIDLKIESKILTDLEKYSSDSLKAWGWYSLFYEEELSFEDKEMALEKAIKEDQDFLEAKIRLIYLQLTEEKNNPKVIENLNNIMYLLDKNILNFYANIAFKNELYYVASVFYEYSLKKDPEQSSLYVNIMKVSYELKSYDKLKFFIKKYIEITEPKNIDFENVGFFLTALGNEEEALKILEKAEEIGRASGKILSMIAFIYMNRKEFKQASEYYEKSFSFIFSETILEDWSACLLQYENYNKTIDVIEKYKDDLPFNSGLECNLAIAYLNINNKDKALKILEHCVKKDKTNFKASALLGNLYFEQKSYTRAQKYILLAEQNEPYNFYWKKLLGDLYFETGDFLESEKYYKKTLDLNKELKIPKYTFIEAKKLKKENNLRDAIKKFYSAYVSDSSLSVAIEEIYNIFIDSEEVDNGIEFFENISEKKKDDALIYLSLHKLCEIKAKGFFAKKWKNKAEFYLENYNRLVKEKKL
ncbi:MAG: hypothetical protein U0457_19670 [Candidatus Sericytochromatia bacterium]